MTYFKPLSRKFGVLSLLLECVLMVGWIRNYSVRDSINLPTGNSSSLQFISGDQCLNLAAMWSVLPDSEMAAFRLYCHDEEDGLRLHAGEVMVEGKPSLFRPTWSSFELGEYRRLVMIVSLPYWSIVLPLTLLSAWLLLSKPDTKNTLQAAEGSSK